MTNKNQCDYCMFLAYDEDLDDEYCTIDMDQDEVERFYQEASSSCPYFRMGDDYTIVKKQGS